MRRTVAYHGSDAQRDRALIFTIDVYDRNSGRTELDLSRHAIMYHVGKSSVPPRITYNLGIKYDPRGIKVDPGDYDWRSASSRPIALRAKWRSGRAKGVKLRLERV